tara:strand:- start:938799 stop:939524 length:726 start_codon:yes stop_codon:yes gene_type:complete
MRSILGTLPETVSPLLGKPMMILTRRLVCRVAAALSLAMTTGADVSAATVELATNGGFETGDLTGWTSFETGPGQQSASTDNPKTGTYSGLINNNAVGASNSLWKQANLGIGTVVPNQLVTISFDARGSYAVPGGVSFAEFFSEVDGGGVSKAELLGGAPLAINGDPNVWTSFMYTATTGPDVSAGVTLQLGAVNSPDASGTTMFFDNVSVTIEAAAVPEPASATLLCLGAVGLVLRRRQR